MTKVAPLHAPDGRFAKDGFTINLDTRTATCPAWRTVAGRPVHCQPRRAHHQHPPPRGPARPRPPPAAGSRLADRQPRDPPQGRTQARPPAAPPPRWAPRPHARAAARRPGLQAAGRRGQPRPPCRPRRELQIKRLGGHARVATSARTPASPACNPTLDPASQPIPRAPWQGNPPKHPLDTAHLLGALTLAIPARSRPLQGDPSASPRNPGPAAMVGTEMLGTLPKRPQGRGDPWSFPEGDESTAGHPVARQSCVPRLSRGRDLTAQGRRQSRQVPP